MPGDNSLPPARCHPHRGSTSTARAFAPRCKTRDGELTHLLRALHACAVASAGRRFGNDDLGRRFYKQRSGSAFSAANYEVFGYNERSELTAADQYAGTYDSGTATPEDDDTYAYDNIGNRTTHTLGDGTGSEAETAYTANALNQYTRTRAST